MTKKKTTKKKTTTKKTEPKQEIVTIASVSSSATYDISDVDARRVYDAIPLRVRRGFNRLSRLIKSAMYCVSVNEGEDTDYLIGKIEAYYKSEEGRGKYARLIMTWLDDEGWTESDQLWNPQRGREADIAESHGKVYSATNEALDDLEATEKERDDFIESHTEEKIIEAAQEVVDNPKNGYKEVDKVRKALYGRMLLAETLKGE